MVAVSLKKKKEKKRSKKNGNEEKNEMNNIDIDDGIPVKQKGISQSIFEASV